MGLMSRTETARPPSWHPSLGLALGCAMSSPTAAMPDRNSAARSIASAIGRWRSSSAPTRPGASRSSRAAGSSNAPSPGSDDAGDWQRTGRNLSKAPRLGSTSPISGSPPDDSQDIAILHRVSSRALKSHDKTPGNVIAEGFVEHVRKGRYRLTESGWLHLKHKGLI